MWSRTLAFQFLAHVLVEVFTVFTQEQALLSVLRCRTRTFLFLVLVIIVEILDFFHPGQSSTAPRGRRLFAGQVFMEPDAAGLDGFIEYRFSAS